MSKQQKQQRPEEFTLTRRKLISRFGALGGILLTGCYTDFYRPPVIRGGLMGVADTLTMASQRMLMSNQQLVQEHDISEIPRIFRYGTKVIPMMKSIND